METQHRTWLRGNQTSDPFGGGEGQGQGRRSCRMDSTIDTLPPKKRQNSRWQTTHWKFRTATQTVTGGQTNSVGMREGTQMTTYRADSDSDKTVNMEWMNDKNHDSEKKETERIQHWRKETEITTKAIKGLQNCVTSDWRNSRNQEDGGNKKDMRDKSEIYSGEILKLKQWPTKHQINNNERTTKGRDSIKDTQKTDSRKTEDSRKQQGNETRYKQKTRETRGTKRRQTS